ncbi:probable cytochrome P450 12a5, mitochondrial [Gigantopelta aegis]|uniref:probable cytochrome P450 12a5, mitochondrial n=1 Tax=Gigantopelta aegis TaxID=1735272 RepID=UPI001B887D44|nr:probable cytochrome P450 12a5, mitochondrial [Gigantopelta aegis]
MFPRSMLKSIGAPLASFSNVWCSTTARAPAALRPAALADECHDGNLSSAVTRPRPFEDMPGPRALPIIGTQWMHYPGGPLYGMTRRDKYARLQELYGDVIKENIVPGILTLVHVFNPRDIETIFRHEGKYPIRQAFFMLKRYNEKYNNNVSGVLSSQGVDWYNVRSQVQKKITNPKFVNSHTNSQQVVADDFVEWIRKRRNQDDVIEDILPYLYRYSTEAIGVVCFNRRVGALDDALDVESEAHAFITAVSEVTTATHSELDSWFLFLYFDTPLFSRFKKAHDVIRRISLKYAQRLLEETTDMATEHDMERGKLIPYLLKETSLSEAHVLTIVSECFFAGVDTTSHCLGFTLYNLCKNPEAMERLVTEIHQFLPDHSPVSSETLGKMTYLRAVIKESLRLNPVTAGNGRTNSTELVLSGYTVPAGMYLGLHTDLSAQQDDFVDDAHSFRPERWLRDDDLHLKPRPFTYLPFGFGKRSCPGKRLAEQEVSLALIKILQNFEVRYRHDVDMEYDVHLLNTPLTPLKFSFTDLK